MGDDSALLWACLLFRPLSVCMPMGLMGGLLAFCGKRAALGYRVKSRAPSSCRGLAKPDWVRREVLRLAALTGAGCRGVAALFNRLYAARRKMSVSKSYVAYTMRNHRYEIARLRREMKHRPARPVPRNALWAVDMTGKGEASGEIHCVLGIEDHGTRALLCLKRLNCGNAWSILGHLFLAISRFGKPRAVRSDNASVFRSRLFGLVCALAGIRQQFTALGCPWQNGRIERLFGTLKAKLDRLEVDGAAALTQLLGQFRFYYNHVRPHQHLAGRTPAEAWSGIDPYAKAPKSVRWFEAWDDLLKGYWLRY